MLKSERCPPTAPEKVAGCIPSQSGVQRLRLPNSRECGVLVNLTSPDSRGIQVSANAVYQDLTKGCEFIGLLEALKFGGL
jgi:hypothetical protein